MSKLVRNNGGGFTIVEVLIVLAIASTIMLVVFLAVPSLQRNQRNNLRRHDLSLLTGVLLEYRTNYGSYPTSCGPANDSSNITFGSGSISVSLSQYVRGCWSGATFAPAGGVDFYTVAVPATGMPPLNSSQDVLEFAVHGSCDPSNNGGAIPGDGAIMYEAESGAGNFVPQCVNI